MTEFFITARSFAAPFFSDESTGYVTADTPALALERFAADYKHPCGLYCAEAWESADAHHKGADPLARWWSNHLREQRSIEKQHEAYSYLGLGPGKFEINGELHVVENPAGGAVVTGV